jgi:hypothetical protein
MFVSTVSALEGVPRVVVDKRIPFNPRMSFVGVAEDCKTHVVVYNQKIDAVQWSMDNSDIVDDVAEQVFTTIGDDGPAVLYTSTGQGARRMFAILAIVHPCIFPGRETLGEMFELAHSIWSTNPSGEGTTKAGGQKRGNGLMKSVGFNLPLYSLGVVKTYVKSYDDDAEALHKVWDLSIRYMNRVEEHCERAMGPTPNRIFQQMVLTKYVDPVLDAGHEVLSTQPPILGMNCHNLHQTCNTAVQPHKDKNDLVTLILWSLRGRVAGPFVLHGAGYFLPIQVVALLYYFIVSHRHI